MDVDDFHGLLPAVSLTTGGSLSLQPATNKVFAFEILLKCLIVLLSIPFELLE